MLVSGPTVGPRIHFAPRRPHRVQLKRRVSLVRSEIHLLIDHSLYLLEVTRLENSTISYNFLSSLSDFISPLFFYVRSPLIFLQF
jgi:hypothetical protein